MAVMELKMTDTCPEHAMGILLSISRNVDLAKDLVGGCQIGIPPISDSELRLIGTQLEQVIKNIGECLSLIPPSTFGDQQYADAVRSISSEMQHAHFEMHASETKELATKMPSLEVKPKEEPTSTETDLYPMSLEVSTENPHFLNTPQLVEILKSTSWVSERNPVSMSESLTTFPQVGGYMEPLYEGFFCPLTKKIMDDPVTIGNGVTYEKIEIDEWFKKFNDSEEFFCPTTDQKLLSKAFNANIALKILIEEWKERNEVARIKFACAALSLASSENMVLEAVKDVQNICPRRADNKIHVRSVGILPLLVKCLGEIVLGHDSNTYVAERASPALVKMVHKGNTKARRAAFKALVQISSYHPNGRILEEAGIIPIMVEEMFIRKIQNEPMNSPNEAAAILANIFESGLDLENLPANSRGQTMTSDYVVCNIIYMLKNSTLDELSINLIRILLFRVRIPRSVATIASVVKETEASYILIEFTSNPLEELAVAAIKLLTVLSPHMEHVLAERLCKTRGQPENLIESPTETTLLTERQAVSAKFLATLPHQNLTLNLALLYNNTLPCGSPRMKKTPLCPVHRGVCSSQNTFCIVDAKAVERLLVCLGHENAEVVEAALSAICTWSDDKIDVDECEHAE